jgi:hypothetical protein
MILKLMMDDGLSSKTGLNVLKYVEEVKVSYKEFVFLLKMVVKTVLVQNYYKNHVILNNVLML